MIITEYDIMRNFMEQQTDEYRIIVIKHILYALENRNKDIAILSSNKLNILDIIKNIEYV